MELKDRIKEKRIERGYTLEELANKVGTSKQTIHRYESGIISNIPSDKIEALANALHTTPAYLMGWTDEEVMARNYHHYISTHATQLYSAASNTDSKDAIGIVIDIMLDLDDAGQDQLIQYGRFLLSQREKS